MKGKVAVVILLLAAIVLTACMGQNSAEQKMSEQIDKQQAHYAAVQPVPWFDYSLERYLMIQLYAARNEAVHTWSVVFSEYQCKIIFQCPSIGYPIPGGTELDNPSQINFAYQEGHGWEPGVIGQAEPNGLFPPGTSAGTFVMCLNSNGTVAPQYIEYYVETFSTPVEVKGCQLVPAEGAVSTLAIDISTEAIQSQSEKDIQSQPTP